MGAPWGVLGVLGRYLGGPWGSLGALGSPYGMSYGRNVAVAAATSMFSKLSLEGRCLTFQALGRVKCENVAVAAARSIFFQDTWEHLGAPYLKMLLWLSGKHVLKEHWGTPEAPNFC